MKKVFRKIFPVILGLVIFLTSCSDTSIGGVSGGNVNNGNGSLDAEINLITLNDYNEYEKFLSKNSMRNDFIEYEDMQELGAFDCFVILDYLNANLAKHYLYGIIDDYGNLISVYVEHEYEDSYTGYTFEKIDSMDGVLNFKNIATDDLRAYLDINGARYEYISGNLNCISKMYGDTKITISFNSFSKDALAKYSSNSKDLLGELLNCDTAEEAVAKLDMMFQ